MDKVELTKLKLQNLFLLRTFVSQVLIVLTGGVVGLFFVEPSIARNIFVVTGALLDIFAIKAFINLSYNIKKNLYDKELN